ncbi:MULTISPECIES: hypothetical protein [Methanobacterium]|jgi:hypothetical protein|nr:MULTISPECIES: hypothetical protein [Methanobacterium]
MKIKLGIIMLAFLAAVGFSGEWQLNVLRKDITTDTPTNPLEVIYQ